MRRQKVESGKALGVVQAVYKKFLSQQECAVYMGVKDEWIRDNVRDSGEVRVFKEKGIYWYLLSDIDKFITSRSLYK